MFLRPLLQYPPFSGVVCLVPSKCPLLAPMPTDCRRLAALVSCFVCLPNPDQRNLGECLPKPFWDTSAAPANITNPIGFILLRKDDITTPLILGKDFDILLGEIEVTVPDVLEDSDYSIEFLPLTHNKS
ncbi:hypothetical protein MKEN_00000100 [Mycena kentingensis (nom. inval.)]|nr:hypothetical protein MKEN_00000100 [Mycena kentingensis (nom. inval.)]